jgi:hypothetical protein
MSLALTALSSLEVSVGARGVSGGPAALAVTSGGLRAPFIRLLASY